MATTLDDIDGEGPERGSLPARGWAAARAKTLARVDQGGRNGEVIIPFRDPMEWEGRIGDAVAIAERFSAGIALMLVMTRRAVPKGYEEYAAKERIRYAHSRYFETLCENELGALRAEVQRAGLECRTFAFQGSVPDAIMSSCAEHRALAVVLRRHLAGGRGLGPWSRRVNIASLGGLKVPIVLLP
jgi:nucleotide-binding universal stress UspA family protein